MLRVDDLRFFDRLSGQRTLAAAARLLNVSASAVTQRLKALEAELGVSLAHRNGRSLILTDEGELLAREGRRILSEIEGLEEALDDHRNSAKGMLRILAPFGFGRRYVAPLCADFQDTHADVAIDLRFTDRLGRYPEQPWDVAIHVGPLADSGLRMKRLAPNERILCAAPSFISVHGAPASLETIDAQHCIAIHENDEDATMWRFAGGAHKRIRPMLASNDGQIAKQWALDGRGIILRSEWDVADDLAAGRLLRLLPDLTGGSSDIVLLFGRGRTTTARARAFARVLGTAFQPPPWRQALRENLIQT